MKLTYTERLNLIRSLPKKENYQNLVALLNLANRLSLKEDEYKDADIEKTDIGTMVKNDNEIDIDLTGVELSIIKNHLSELDKECGLTISELPLYEKFVLGQIKDNVLKIQK